MRKSLELTLAILKPHVVKATQSVEAIHKIIVENNFLIVKSSSILISRQQVENFYGEHKNKFFYNRLIASMTSGKCEVHILAKDNAIEDWRKILGPTKVYQTIFSNPTSVRGTYGLTDTRNAAHGSDSMESAEREIAVFFPSFSAPRWLQENKDRYYRGLLRSDLFNTLPPAMKEHTDNKNIKLVLLDWLMEGEFYSIEEYLERSSQPH